MLSIQQVVKLLRNRFLTLSEKHQVYNQKYLKQQHLIQMLTMKNKL